MSVVGKICSGILINESKIIQAYDRSSVACIMIFDVGGKLLYWITACVLEYMKYRVNSLFNINYNNDGTCYEYLFYILRRWKN